MTMPKRLMQLRLPDRVKECTEVSARYGRWERRLDALDKAMPIWCLFYSYGLTMLSGMIIGYYGIPFDWKTISVLCIFVLATFYLIMWGISKGRSYCRRKSQEWTLLGISTISKITLEQERKRNNA